MATEFAQTSEQFSRLYEQSQHLFDDVADRTKHLYEDAREWVPEHQGTIWALTGIGAGACLLGYLAGRRARQERTLPSMAAQTVSATRSQMPELDIRPFFKFISLWMLYRVATKD
jgi:hypothetical protein